MSGSLVSMTRRFEERVQGDTSSLRKLTRRKVNRNPQLRQVASLRGDKLMMYLLPINLRAVSKMK